MQPATPTLSKEQYEHLVKLVDKKEPDFYVEKKTTYLRRFIEFIFKRKYKRK
jgi:hypothetical protein